MNGRLRQGLAMTGVLLVLLVPFVVPIPESLDRLRGLRSFGILAHFLLPCLLTLILHRYGPLRGKPVAAMIAAFSMTASCEFLQVYVARHPRVQDAGVDLLGAATALGWLLHRRGHSRRPLLLSAACGLVLLILMRDLPGFILAEQTAVARFPLLGDFETPAEMYLWHDNTGGGGRISRLRNNEGSFLCIAANDGDLFPGAVARGLPRDWSAKRTLRFRARVRKGKVRWILVRLDDFTSRHDARFISDRFPLSSQWRTYEMDLVAARDKMKERAFRLDDIDSVLLYLNDVEGDSRVLVDDIELR